MYVKISLKFFLVDCGVKIYRPISVGFYALWISNSHSLLSNGLLQCQPQTNQDVTCWSMLWFLLTTVNKSTQPLYELHYLPEMVWMNEVSLLLHKTWWNLLQNNKTICQSSPIVNTTASFDRFFIKVINIGAKNLWKFIRMSISVMSSC